MTAPKTMLERCEDVVLIQEGDDMLAYNVFEYFAGYAGQRNRPVVAGVVHIALLEYWCDECTGPVLREFCTNKQLVVQGG